MRLPAASISLTMKSLGLREVMERVREEGSEGGREDGRMGARDHGQVVLVFSHRVCGMSHCITGG